MKKEVLIKQILKKCGIALLWLLIWQLVSVLTGLEFLISSPVGSFKALIKLICTKAYYLTVLNTFEKIIAGFILAFIAGVILGTLSGKFYWLHELLSPLVYLCKALPMVAFIIFILICFGAKGVSTIISFIVVFPVVYNSCNNGYKSVDIKMLEMARVFRLGSLKKMRYLYIPSISKHVCDNISIALGMCWKAGISAEVIGLVNNTIGTNMYYAKLYIMPDDLIAWSITVILMSLIFEYIFMKIMRLVQTRIER